VKWNLLKSGLPNRTAQRVDKVPHQVLDHPVNATPMTMPTARSTTLPRKVNWRNSVSKLRMGFLHRGTAAGR
jgi:hypothetical protein